MGTNKTSVKRIEFDRSANHWKVSGFDAGVRCDNVVLTDKQELHLMDSFADLAQDCVWEKDEKEGNKAIEYYNKAMNFAPSSRSIRKTTKYKVTLANIYRGRSQAYAQIKDYDNAIEDANMAIKIDPKDGYAHDIRAYAYLGAGNEGAACLDFIKSKEIYASDDGDDLGLKTVPLWKSIYRAVKRCLRYRTVA